MTVLKNCKILADITNGEYKRKSEYFKYMARGRKESELLNKINGLLSKPTRSSEEEVELKETQVKIDQTYKDLAKGAFIRSRPKWETNSSYFFALEKRNGKRKSLNPLNINRSYCTDIKIISTFLSSFYINLYTSNFHRHRDGGGAGWGG